MASHIEDDLHPYSTPFLEELDFFEAGMLSPLSRHSLGGAHLVFGILASLLVHMAFLATLTFFHSRLPATREPVPVMVHLVRGDELGISLGESGQAGAGGTPEEGLGEAAASEEPQHEASQRNASLSTPEPSPAVTPETSTVPEPAKEEIREGAKPDTTIAKPKPARKPRPKPQSQPQDLTTPPNPSPARASEASDGKQKSMNEQMGGKTAESPTTAEGAGGENTGAAGRGDPDGDGRGSGSRDGPGHGSGGPGVPAGELHLNQVERPPQVLRRVEPTYPFAARSRNLTGKIMVKVLVSPDGEVTKPSILEANPKGIFEECVLEAVRQWRFKPGYHHGRAVATWVVLPITFKLTN